MWFIELHTIPLHFCCFVFMQSAIWIQASSLWRNSARIAINQWLLKECPTGRLAFPRTPETLRATWSNKSVSNLPAFIPPSLHSNTTQPHLFAVALEVSGSFKLKIYQWVEWLQHWLNLEKEKWNHDFLTATSLICWCLIVYVDHVVRTESREKASVS